MKAQFRKKAIPVLQKGSSRRMWCLGEASLWTLKKNPKTDSFCCLLGSRDSDRYGNQSVSFLPVINQDIHPVVQVGHA